MNAERLTTPPPPRPHLRPLLYSIYQLCQNLQLLHEEGLILWPRFQSRGSMASLRPEGVCPWDETKFCSGERCAMRMQ